MQTYREKSRNIGFISFRISGTDGVSLETKKWAEIFERNGHNCFYMAGELDTPPQNSYTADLLHFKHAEIVEIYKNTFNCNRRSPEITEKLHHCRDRIKKELYQFIEKFSLDLIIPENTVTIPLNIPLALATTEIISETGIPTIAHHHDFYWERKRFLTNAVWEYINCAYPPHLMSVQHVVINSSAANQMGLRTGISSTLVPNIMDFKNPPTGIDDYNADIRSELGIGENQLLVLQPTRVVQRKGIEYSIELVKRMKKDAVLVISHASGDEGFEYEQRVMEYADLMEINALFVDKRIGEHRGLTADGKKIYTLQDIYPHADLVTYPSLIEGFGNAFLEAIYFKKPILVNNYSVYSHDIKPKGFDVVEMDDFISNRTVDNVCALLDDPPRIKKMVDHNYLTALRYYSYEVAEYTLNELLRSLFGLHLESCE